MRTYAENFDRAVIHNDEIPDKDSGTKAYNYGFRDGYRIGSRSIRLIFSFISLGMSFVMALITFLLFMSKKPEDQDGRSVITGFFVICVLLTLTVWPKSRR